MPDLSNATNMDSSYGSQNLQTQNINISSMQINQFSLYSFTSYSLTAHEATFTSMTANSATIASLNATSMTADSPLMVQSVDDDYPTIKLNGTSSKYGKISFLDNVGTSQSSIYADSSGLTLDGASFNATEIAASTLMGTSLQVFGVGTVADSLYVGTGYFQSMTLQNTSATNRIYGNLVAYNGALINSGASITDGLVVSGGAQVSGDLTLVNSLKGVLGVATVSGNLSVSGIATAIGGLGGTLLTASQPNITSLGSVSFSGIATSSGGFSGSLLTASQPNVTGVGTLTNLSVSGICTAASGFAGTLLTASQPNITGVGTLTSLRISGPLYSQPHYYMVQRGSTQSIPYTSWATVMFDTAVANQGNSVFGYGSGKLTNVSGYTAVVLVNATVTFDATAGNIRGCCVQVNNSSNTAIAAPYYGICYAPAVNATYTSTHTSVILSLANNSYITVMAYNGWSSAVNVLGTNCYTTLAATVLGLY